MRRVAPSAEAPSLHRSPAATEVVAAAGAAGLVAACFLSPDHAEDGPVICPFRRLTGLPCPGCGLTRSWVYLAHGWWRESLAAHPFGWLAALVVLMLCAGVVRARVRHTPPPDVNRFARRPAVLAVAGAWLIFAIVRLATVDDYA